MNVKQRDLSMQPFRFTIWTNAFYHIIDSVHHISFRYIEWWYDRVVKTEDTTTTLTMKMGVHVVILMRVIAHT